ncbi:MAG: FimB/Mfa2 family fimbrial subunit [Prevotella sp.]|jgi:hypothetical protein
MKKLYFVYVLLGLLCFSFASCQKVVTEEIDEIEEATDGQTVRFNVVQLEQIPFADIFASRGTDVKSVCNRISLALYQNGVKVKQINQTSNDADFGQLKLNVAAGTYKVVLIAHSGLKAPTMTDPEKITFNGKVTDTFYYCKDLELTGGSTYDIMMKRAVAMFRLVIADKIPSNVALMHFYYTGGSSTFDAVHGVGNVNSRQTEFRDVTEEMHGKSGTFEVYTFPHSDGRKLKIQVTAHDAGNNVLVEKVFEDVEVKRNVITQYRGSFFGGEIEDEDIESGGIQLNLYSEDEWKEVVQTY